MEMLIMKSKVRDFSIFVISLRKKWYLVGGFMADEDYMFPGNDQLC